MKQDIYQRVTDRIMADLEQGVRPWLKPWSVDHAAGKINRPLRSNFQPYSGINVLMLWGASVEAGYVSPVWITYKQAQSLGAQVRKGEHGSPVVYASTFTKTEQTDDGREVEEQIPFLRAYTVFNAEQVDGLPEQYYPKIENPLPLANRIERADAFVESTGAKIRHAGGSAFYSGTVDQITMPPFESFKDPESYYATIFHELTHWTKPESRLNRNFGRKAFGDPGYAREELVAELGAAFLCADLGITPEPREDHASYLASWLKVLKDDKRAIFQAASYASKAADYLSAKASAVERAA